MKCSRCQHENSSALKFCGECGARLAAVCASCGAANALEQKFCGECGAKLSPDSARAKLASPDSYTPKHLAEKILTSKSALEGERKQVTVLFSDLKGSMELLADRDPEEARKILDPVLERMMEAVHHYEGTVNQVMGDGIMALFGAPLAHEDHALRASYAALAMQSAIRLYGDEARQIYGVTVQVRIGLNSGEVVVRSIGNDLHMDYSAVGQTTHLASRMEQLASPGSIYLSRDTFRLVEGFVQVSRLGSVPVKGMPHPVEVFELTGATGARTRIQAAVARGLTRFVGRDREVEALCQAMAQAQAGRGQVVAVVGEPGVGKSRLFWEFTHSHRTQGWLLLESGSVSYGKATAYLPVVDLLKVYFKIAARDEQREIQEKVTGKLLTLDRSLEPTLAAFLSLLDVPTEDPAWRALDPPQRRRHTLDAVKRLLFKESQVQPLIVVFEDLHWIDAETQALLDTFMEGLPTHRILLLVNYRPEYQHGWMTKSYYSQLRIDPLPPERAEELLRALLGEDLTLEPLRQLLSEGTAGNPFFLEESVRTLIETGALIGEHGRFQLAAPIESIQVPKTVQAVLAARIDRLQAEDKRVLQTAAVIGKDVPLVLLQAIANLSDDALQAALSRLQAAEFLYEASLFPDLEYTFKHALTHDVAYATLLQDRRKALHARIVAATERVYGSRLAEHTERLAYHAPRGELWDRAVVYLRQAGQKAFGRSANGDAVAWFDQALEALAHLPQTDTSRTQEIDLLIDLRNALLPLAEYERMLTAVQRAGSLAEALQDRRRISATSSLLAFSSFSLGQFGSAVAAGDRALAIARELDDVALEAPANNYLGYLYTVLGEFDKAKRHLLTNMRLLVGARAGELFYIAAPPGVLSRMALMIAHAEVGEFDNAFAVEQDSVKLAQSINQPFSTALIYWAVGRAHAGKGDFDNAIARFEVAERLTREWSLVINRPYAVTALGYSYATVGRLDEALPLLVEGLESFRRGTLWHPHSRASWLAEGLLRLDRTEDAQRVATLLLQLATETGARRDEALALRVLGNVYSRAECLERGRAEEHYIQSLGLGQRLGMRPLTAHCHFGLTKLYRQTNKCEQAREHLTTAITMYREMGMQFWMEQAEVETRGLA